METSSVRFKERDLPKHLVNGNGTSETQGEQAPADLALTDYQLNEALTLLKGLNILARSRQG
jgi:hypothetical protein